MTALPVGLRLSLTDEPDPAFRTFLIDGISTHHAGFLGEGGSRPLVLRLEDAHGAPQAGLWGRSFFAWMFIELLFVGVPWRGQGLGGLLLGAAETQARARGCTGAWLDVMNPSALAFYLRHGFESFGELPGYPNGTRRVFLRKTLGF